MKIKVSEKELLNPGYRRIYTPPSQAQEETLRSGESKLHELKKGQRIRPRRVRARRQSMNEAGLIALMQANGIGRPATYAIAIETLLKRQYIHKESNGALVVSERGRSVLKFLLEAYPALFASTYSAEMEQQLDEIAATKKSYEYVIRKLQTMVERALKKEGIRE